MPETKKAPPSPSQPKKQNLATPKRTDARADALRENLRKRKEWAKEKKK